MMKKMILTVVAVAAIAVSAKAQLYAQVGDPVAISSLTDANAQGGVTYEWYRNGTLIPGCNEASCLIPVYMATGTNVKFQRRAIALGCAIGNASNANTVTITFCNVVQGGVCWGDVHVDGWRTLATKPDANTTFFQFNRTKAWAATGAVTGWPTTNPANGSWHVDSSPCPDGWRLPTRDEYTALGANSTPAEGVWAVTNARGNSVPGRFYGKRASSCSLPDDMQGCVFFPASGLRSEANGGLSSQGTSGYGWASTQVNSNNAYSIYLDAYVPNSTANGSKKYGFPVRCVRGGE